MMIAVFCLNVAHPSIGLPKKKTEEGLQTPSKENEGAHV